MMNSYSKQIFVFSSLMYPSKNSVIKFLSNNIDNNSTLWVIENEQQKVLKNILKEYGYKIHTIQSLYKTLGPQGEEAIYHLCLKNTSSSIFFIGLESNIPRPMMIASEYQLKDNIKFKII